MFSIDYGTGLFGGIVIALLVGAGVIAAIFLLAASKQVHDEVVEEEHDRGNDDFPVA